VNIDAIKKIAIIGAGLMGHGIAQEFAQAGYEVHLHDISEGQLQHALKLIESNLSSTQQAETYLARIHASTDLEEVATDADVVIEAVLENLALKQAVFQKLDRLCPEHTILASNTSTLMPSKLATGTQRPDKILVTHYFNPPHLIPLVEIVRHDATSDETVSVIFDLLRKVGKSPVILNREVPGFVANRLQMALFREALSLVEQGVASPQDIDTVVKTGFGRRYAAAGPFAIWELAGWDLALAASEYVVPDLDASPALSPLLKEMVEAGECSPPQAILLANAI
jgi:3-hydroxybutyryl-CoA dehydrogenase